MCVFSACLGEWRPFTDSMKIISSLLRVHRHRAIHRQWSLDDEYRDIKALRQTVTAQEVSRNSQ